MTSVRVEQTDGSVHELIVLGGTTVNNYGEQSRVEVRVLRNEWFDIVDSIDKVNDEFYISKSGSDVFGGRLVNSNNTDNDVVLEIGSWEEDALGAEPTGQTEEFVASDDTIIKDAISRVSGLSAGTIETINNDITILFSNTTPAGMIREVQRTTRGFVFYNADKTVDYIADPSDGSTSGTVGPQNRNVQEDFEVLEDEREDFTHVRVLGAQQGKARIQAEAVKGSYDGTGREVWQNYPDKDITSKSRAQDVADEIVTELESSPRKLTVETVLFGLDVGVGDRLNVVSDQDNIDTVLWVTKAAKRLDGSTDVEEVTLSNRLLLDESDDAKRRRDVERFNQGFQGDVVTINSGGYRAPVDSTNAYRFSVRVPDDVVGELDAQLEVEGLPYRAYSGGAANGGGVASTTNSGGGENSTTGVSNRLSSVKGTVEDLDFDTTLGPGDDVVWSGDLSTSFDGHVLWLEVEILTDASESVPMVVDVTYEEPGSTFERDAISFEPSTDYAGSLLVTFPVLEVPAGSTINTTIANPDSSSFTYTLDSSLARTYYYGGDHEHDFFVPSHSHDIDLPDHTHMPDPGITEFATNTPSNVDVRIDDGSGFTTVASDVASGEFIEVVDIGGEFSSGFNTVEVTSDSLGHIRATAFLDVYRQITQ